MKRIIMITILISTVILSGTILAQPPMGFQPPPPDAGPEMGEPPPHHTPPVDRWMQFLQQKDPEEFERLSTLRKDDPEAFRNELAEKLRHHRGKGREGRHGMHNMMEENTPEMQALTTELNKLSRSYKETDDPAEKEALRTTITDTVRELYELRYTARQEKLQEAEAKIQKLREHLAQRYENRDKIIERRVQELTDGELVEW